MKLGELIDLYNITIKENSKNWVSILNNINNGKSQQYPKDENTYAIELTNGEIQLAENIKLYNKIENIAFYICDAKNKIKIPELGFSISYAEEYLNILKNKLFYHSKLLEIITDTVFEVNGIDSNGELDISLRNISRGFDVNAVNESIDYLEDEINKYEDYLSRAMWNTEVAFENEDIEILSVGVQSDKGTVKKKEEKIDLSEYMSPKDAIKKMQEPVEEKFKAKGCPICNSKMREVVERRYVETEGNVMNTLDFATTKCGLLGLTPNMLVHHLDYHDKISAQYNTIEEGFNNPDLHSPMDHILETTHNTKIPINNLKYKNNLKPNTNNPDHHIPYQHIEE